jgi:hypothetical protein
MRKNSVKARWDGEDPGLDSFGVGGGRKELNRLMTLYSRDPRKREGHEDKPPKHAPRARVPRSRMVNLAKIQDILAKTPWERRADEVEMVSGPAHPKCKYASMPSAAGGTRACVHDSASREHALMPLG